MQKAERPQRFAFRDRYLAAISAAALLLCSMTVQSQVIQKNTQYGVEYARLVPDSTLYFPTGCGAPSGIASLRSVGFGNGEKKRMAAIYADTCGHAVYWLDWSDTTWKPFGTAGGDTDTTSLSNRINQKLNWADTATMLTAYLRAAIAAVSYYPLSTNPAGYLTSNGLPAVINALQVVNAGGAASWASGTYTSRPTPGVPNRFYAATDSAKIYFDNGSTWLTISGGSGTPTIVWGGITGMLSSQTDLAAALAAKLTAANNLNDLNNVGVARTNLGLGTAAQKDVPSSGNASTSQVVQGNDTRLTDSRAPSGPAAGSLSGTYPNPSIANNVIGNSNLTTMPANTFKINNTGSSTAPIDATLSQMLTALGMDTLRTNVWLAIASKMTNYGNSPGSLKGTYAGIPAATGYPTGTEYIATDSGFHYVDTGSGGTRGWKRIAGGGSAAASLSLAAYSLAGNATNATSPAASLGMPFLYVDWFNPHKDSVTDDIAAFQACYDALPATGGMMMVGTGNYLWSTALRIKTGKPVKIIGINGKALTYGPGYASINDSSSTKIFYNQLTGPAVYNAANGTIIQNIAFICDRGTTASTNYAIYCDSGSNVIIDGNGFKNFNYNFSLRYGVQYRIVNNVSINAHSVGYNIQSYDSLNNSPLDAGDGWFIDNQAYVTPGFSYASTDTCLRVMNGGGLKIRGNKLGGSKYGAYIPWGHFSDLRIEDNSFEAVSDIPLYIKLRSGGQLANCHIMRNQFIGNGLACIKLDASAGVSVAQLEIGSNILQNRAISQDTGIVLIGTFNNSKIDRTNICNGCAVPVYTNIANGYGAGTISIDVPPGTQTVTEAARIKIDLFKGTMINLNLVNNNDTLEIVGGGTVTYFDLQMGIGANVSNIVLAGGSFNYSGGNAFNVGVQPNAVNLIHARTVTPTTYIVMGVDHRWTSNSIAFIGNNQLQEDGTEFNWNPTTNRLGLGVTTPLYAIHSLRGDGVTGFADQTNAWTKEFYTNQGNSNTNLIRLISGAGTTTSKLNGIGGMMNGLEFGYIDDLGNQRASAGIFSRLEAAPVGSTGSMPTKVGIFTSSIAQGFTTRNQPWTTGNVRQVWHSNGQIVSGILAPADTLPQGNYRQTVRGSTYFDDDSIATPNMASTGLDTVNFKLDVISSTGVHYKSPWPVPGGSGTPGGSNTQIQFNSSGAFSGSSSLTWNGSKLTTSGLNISSISSAGTNDSVLTRDPATGDIRARYGQATIHFASGLRSPTPDSVILDGTLNQSSTINTAGFDMSITNLPNKSTALSTDSMLIENLAGKLFKLPIVTSGITTVGTFSGSSIAKGASISGNTITFGPADGTNPGMVTTGTQSFAGNKTVAGSITSLMYGSNSAASGPTGGLGAGTSPTIAIAGSDQDGLITLTTGTSPSSSADIVGLSTSVNPPTSGPCVTLTPGNAAAAALTGTSAIYVTSTGPYTFKLVAGSTALAASTQYKWYYHMGGN
jgi:hypothetical protein